MRITKDKEFYKSFLFMMVMVALQNVLAYSVNMADNLMLGNYSQAALSGAATVNQIQFMLQQTINGMIIGMVAINSQYWGKKEKQPIRLVTGIALKIGMILAILLFLCTTFFPENILRLFTSDQSILDAGVTYLHLLRYSYILYTISTIFLGMLRSVETVQFAFYISVMSFFLNVGINYTLIFGHFGAPELGITGAAIGTLVTRAAEFLVIIIYVWKIDQKVQFFTGNPFAHNGGLLRDFWRVSKTTTLNSIIWSLATPVQTSILGHLSSDAIAANSVSVTMFQYLKVMVNGESSASSVSVGRMLGSGKNTKEELKPYINAMQCIYVVISLFLGGVLFLIRIPLLSIYNLSPSAMALANELLIMMVFVFIGMGYQMPCGAGIVQGGGDAAFSMRMNLISTWGISIPLALMATFWWKLPVLWIVFLLNSDQIFKGIPIFIHVNNYKWIRILTREKTE